MARTTKKQTEKTTEKQEVETKTLTRAEKKTAAQELIKKVLQKNPRKHNDLIDEVSKSYAQKFSGEDTENINDVKGRVGSVLDIMKKDGEVLYEGGMYALKQEKSSGTPMTVEVEKATVKEEAKTKPAKKATKKAVIKTVETEENAVAHETLLMEEKTETKKTKTAKKAAKAEEKVEKAAPKKSTKKTVLALKTKEETVEARKEEPIENPDEEKLPLPPAPMQPIAPVAPITPEIAPEPIPEKAPEKEPENTPAPEKKEEKAAKKSSRSKTKKAETVVVKEPPSQEVKMGNEPPMVALNEEKTNVKKAEIAPLATAETAPAVEAEQVEIKNPPIVKEKGELAPKTVVDMSFLFGNVKPKTEKAAPPKKEEKTAETIVRKPVETQEVKAEKIAISRGEEKTETKQPEPKKEQNQEQKQESKKVSATLTKKPATRENVKNIRKVAEKPQTVDERLRDTFLKRIRALGGDYFEYYSVYLLERYSMKNGRRLEGMKISGGDHDGGIDGEIELTDKFGFKETIYIQSKNWDPEKGKEEYWVVGETLLQQFIGACACRQAKDGKQHCRGIFITTSRFTPEAKRILEDMSDKIVGYDGADLYEAAKECKFGLLYENGNWKLDEKLLSGTKAFFNML